MRVAISTIASLALLLGGTVSAAEEPSDPGDVATQQLTLPGFEVSLEVPADWQVEPLIGSPFSESPHPDSPFTVRLWTGAGSDVDRAGCYLFAYSRLSCQAPVDLEAELRDIGPPWEAFPTAPAAYVADEAMGEWACVRHFSSDGADLFEAQCCGETVPADGWSSIVQTLQLPEQTRPVRVAATKRDLVKDVKATHDLWGGVFGGTLFLEGDGTRKPAQKQLWDPRVEAAVEELARPARTISIDERVYRGDDGDEVLVVDGIRARKADLGTKADPDDVRDAMLAFSRTEWRETRDGDPILETLPVGDYRATRAVFDDGAAPEYLVASGNSALKLRAATDEIAQSWLEGLPCYHLDVFDIITDVLIANRTDQ